MLTRTSPSQCVGRRGARIACFGVIRRALGRLDGTDMVWFWIGPHGQYDKLI